MSKKNTKALIGLAAMASITAVGIAKSKSANLILPEDFTITAHTGCEHTKDNSIDSIIAAAVAGADCVEFDLNFTNEGKAVLSHNAPHGDEVLLIDAFKEIKKFNLFVNIDVKSKGDFSEIEKIAEEYSLLDKIYFTGINENDVAEYNLSSIKIPYYLNLNPDFDMLNNIDYLYFLTSRVINSGAIGINLQYNSCTKSLCDAFHNKGLLVSVFTLDNRFDMKKVISCGPDNITTKKPKLLKNIIEDGFSTKDYNS